MISYRQQFVTSGAHIAADVVRGLNMSWFAHRLGMPRLLVGVLLCSASTTPVLGQCGWDWSYPGGEMDGGIVEFAVFDDGTGPSLYAGGYSIAAGGVSINRISRWDGTYWWPLGIGMDRYVHAIHVFDDGSGPALYAGGRFTTAGGVSANHIAKWDGTQWSALGSGIDYYVYALEVFDDGSGPALYAGGYFTHAGGVSAEGIAKWDGQAWSPLGNGIPTGTSNWVNDLAVYDDGTGPALYAGGRFVWAGSAFARKSVV